MDGAREWGFTDAFRKGTNKEWISAFKGCILMGRPEFQSVNVEIDSVLEPYKDFLSHYGKKTETVSTVKTP